MPARTSVDFLCGIVPHGIERQVKAAKLLVDRDSERVWMFQHQFVEIISSRYMERGVRLNTILESPKAPKHRYSAQVHSFLTQQSDMRIPCPDLRGPAPPPPTKGLFNGLPSTLADVFGSDVLRATFMGANVLQWEADVMYPVWLSLWTVWMDEWDNTDSGLAVLPLAPLLRRVGTASFSFLTPLR